MQCLDYLAWGDCLTGRFDEGLALAEEAIKLDATRIESRIGLGLIQQGSGKPEAAVATLRDAVERAKAARGPESEDGFKASFWLAWVHLRQGDYSEAEAILHDLRKGRLASRLPKKEASEIDYAIGAALLGRKKYDEAGPLLRQGYEGLRRKLTKDDWREQFLLEESLDRLIELAEATGKADEVKVWKAERAKPSAGAKPAAENK